MSETAQVRELLAQYCQGFGADIGFGGSAITPTAITFDMQTPYTNVGGDRQILRGSAENLSMFCDESLDYIYSGHLLEDWTYADLRTKIIPEWHRVIRTGGLLVTNCPDQQKYLRCNEENGTMHLINLAHKEDTFSLKTFKELVIFCGETWWDLVYENNAVGPYSWVLVLRKR